MSLSVTPYSNISFKSKTSQPTPKQPKTTAQGEPQNPISRKGETLNLIKATFLGGLALGIRLLGEIFDGDFVFETAEKGAKKLVDKSGKLIDKNQKQISIKIELNNYNYFLKKPWRLCQCFCFV